MKIIKNCEECGKEDSIDCASGLCESCANAFRKEEMESEALEDRKNERRKEERERQCEFCSNWYEEEELDLVKIEEGESVWLCRSCEGDMDKLKEKEE